MRTRFSSLCMLAIVAAVSCAGELFRAFRDYLPIMTYDVDGNIWSSEAAEATEVDFLPAERLPPDFLTEKCCEKVLSCCNCSSCLISWSEELWWFCCLISSCESSSVITVITAAGYSKSSASSISSSIVCSSSYPFINILKSPSKHGGCCSYFFND